MDAQLEGLRNQLLPLNPLPPQLAVLMNTVDRMERNAKAEAEARELRDEAQDKRLAAIEKGVDKGNRRVQWALAAGPVVVALITVAGLLLKG